MFELHPFLINVFRLALWLVILAAIFVPLERAFALHSRQGPRGEILTDIGFYFMNSLLPGFLIAVPMAAFATWLHQVQPPAMQTFMAELPIWVKLPAALFVLEFGAYWAHRWAHEVPFLWRFHRVHHTPERIDWLVSTHAHPVDMVFVRICGLVPLYALGLSQAAAGTPSMVAVIAVLITTLWGFFIHANVPWRFGFLEQIISTPAFHHWHHTNDEHINTNYAPLLPFIDRMFGTMYLPAHWPPCYGIGEEAPAVAAAAHKPAAVQEVSALCKSSR